jgi:hypothetical protein
MDVLLFALVTGAVTLAIGVDVGFVLAWVTEEVAMSDQRRAWTEYVREREARKSSAENPAKGSVRKRRTKSRAPGPERKPRESALDDFIRESYRGSE